MGFFRPLSTKPKNSGEDSKELDCYPDGGQLKSWHWICGIAAGLFYAVFIWKNSFMVSGVRFFSLFDDGMISMRYAKNLADGFGLRWNPGEAPVEGYTNFLWTLYMAAIHLLPIALSKTSLLVMLTGVAILLANLLVVKSVAERIVGKDSYVPLIAVFLTAFYYPLIYWTLRGMEVGFFCLLINAAILAAFRLEDRYSLAEVWWLALACCAAVLTRPDAIVPIAVIGMFLLYVIWQHGFKRGYLIIPFAIAAVAAGQTAFRVAYYGDPLPNTYYLKVTGVTLLERGARGFEVLYQVALYHLWPVLLILAVGLAMNFKRLISPKVLLLLGIFAGQASYSVYVGGDAWDWMLFSNRYLTVAMPALFVALGLAVTMLCQFRQMALMVTLPALGVVLLQQSLWYFEVGSTTWHGPALALVGALSVATGLGMLLLNSNRRVTPSSVSLAAILLVCLTMNIYGVTTWFSGKGQEIQEDAEASRAGLLLGQGTAPDTTIAYVKAGAAPYFAGRRAIDLLGKSDPAIAKGTPATKFYPGHNKWNYDYSIGKLKPDLVAALWKATAADTNMMTNWGYALLRNGMYLRQESANKVNVEVLCP